MCYTQSVLDIKNLEIKQSEERNISSSNVNGFQHIHSKSRIKLSTLKNTSDTKTSIIKLETITRPDVLHSYLSYSEILQYLDYVKLRFTNFIKIHTIGTTFERRPIKCIEINWNSKQNVWSQTKRNRSHSAPIHNIEIKQLEVNTPINGRNIVFIEGGTHAREWISVTVALNCIHQLTEQNLKHRNLLRKLIFYIVPVLNPDGYEYTRNVHRLWRKNRRPHNKGNHVGTDCNRNFDFHWDQCRSKAKRNTYQGDKPFSEPETKALAAILHKLSTNILFFLSLHSYAQSIMYPWGYTKILPKSMKLMESVAIAGCNVIKALTGHYYRVGSISHITKQTIAGSILDCAHGVVDIPLTLVMELPSVEDGFQPPSNKIYPLGMESWHGIREMCRQACNLKIQIEKEAGQLLSQNKIKSNKII